ncbi:hypothetical protein [Gracilibacillus sp. YIM 98692]|uniref:hypothetical protein n=1 Tax=Gracilibacillus sp. YIM 98692 TaxID=2663532 RepID=UPI0013D58D48|nr:hypothetical protein [Gracilibacillus sp. YIM 98692]
MKIKKIPFALSFATAALFVIGSAAFAHEDTESNGMGNMMNSHNGNGMMNMMENGNMSNMMKEEMMDDCSRFMDSYEGEIKTE